MNFYDATAVHRLLVDDKVRTEAFRASIVAAVKNGDVVLDVGTGSGILSLFAAQAGARRVYAVERAPGAARLARKLVDDNGYADTVQVIEGDAATAVLHEPVDVIVSEWLGSYGVDENMLWPVLLARDRWLKPEGAMIPAVVTAWIAPVQHTAGAVAATLHNRPYGLDLSALAPYSLDEVVWLPDGLQSDHLKAEPQPLWVTDCAHFAAADARKPYAAELTFELTGSGVNGLVTWFSADLPGGVILANGPDRPATHWGQFLFPVGNAHALQAGDRLEVGFHNVPWGIYGSQHIWSTRAGGPREVHDTRRHWHPRKGPPWRTYQAG